MTEKINLIDHNEALRQIQKKLMPLKPKAVYLFGSYACGKPSKNSDLDLLIILNSLKNRRERQIQVRRLLRNIHFPKDILVRTPQEMLSLKNDQYAIENIAIHKGKKIL
ncbi:MAG: nucleotidyltransferase domain-containing protein [Candidatus Margulisbacteria bacterium]|nr:nucleotidyltransferase domain-containing protein [Candidatus Margulisiibacteriota bacterium]